MLGATIRFTCFRWADNRAVRTKYAAVAGERTEQSLAGFAFVEKDARIRWHFFVFRDAAIRTCDRRYVSCPGHLVFLRMYKIHSEKGFARDRAELASATTNKLKNKQTIKRTLTLARTGLKRPEGCVYVRRGTYSSAALRYAYADGKTGRLKRIAKFASGWFF